ncbi:aromatic amino acid ammonia-lyase [Achromobacter xylosoxidans]
MKSLRVDTHRRAARACGRMALLASLLLGAAAQAAADCSVTLDGKSLTAAQVLAVARQDCAVAIAPAAAQRAARAYDLLLAYARLDKPVYGLNRGVGLNKDQTIFQGGEISPEVRRLSEQFNRNLLHSHSAAYGAEAPRDVTRAAMLIRLNTALFGGSGMQPAVLEQYAAFLNRDVTPVMLGEGSVGQADITILPQIGLVMMGEGEAWRGGQRMSAAQPCARPAWRRCARSARTRWRWSAPTPTAPRWRCWPRTMRALLAQADAVAALSLEGLDGNLAPLLPPAQAQRPYAGQRQTAERMLGLLRGSALWRRDAQRPLQDPLSFRTVSQVHGAARDLLALLDRQLQLQINSSDDNPTVVLDAAPAADASDYETQYYVTDGPVRGAVMPSAGFDPSAWALPLQGTAVALSQVAQLSAQRTLRLTDPGFTRLPRFLSPGNGAIGYGPIQKTVSSLAADVRALAGPVVTDVQPQAGNIEDVGTNAPLTGLRVAGQVAALTRLLAVELMHGAQAVDLRYPQGPAAALGQGTASLWRDFRKQVPYMAEDRRNDTDVITATAFLRQARGGQSAWARADTAR